MPPYCGNQSFILQLQNAFLTVRLSIHIRTCIYRNINSIISDIGYPPGRTISYRGLLGYDVQ